MTDIPIMDQVIGMDEATFFTKITMRDGADLAEQCQWVLEYLEHRFVENGSYDLDVLNRVPVEQMANSVCSAFLFFTRGVNGVVQRANRNAYRFRMCGSCS